MISEVDPSLEDVLKNFPAYSLIKMANGTVRIGASCEGKHIEFKGDSELEVSLQMLKYCKQNNYL